MEPLSFNGTNKDFQAFIEALEANDTAIKDLKASLDALANQQQALADALTPCEECDGVIACYSHCKKYE